MNAMRLDNEPADCCHQTLDKTKEFVIIGNGPSAITLSYLLAGNWPYYEPIEQHSNEELHARLTSPGDCENISPNSSESQIASVSLVQRDLSYLSNGLTGRSRNPVSLLFDALQHPDADIGSEIPSCLRWTYHPERKIPHIALGSGQPGGSWSKMADCNNTLTISLGTWMQLPGLGIREWFSDNKRESRVPLGRVAKYYRDYVKYQGLEENFRNHSQIIRLFYREPEKLWQVDGLDSMSNHFSYLTPRVVLATGVNEKPNNLGIPGENLPFVMKSLNDFERILSKRNRNSLKDPILIIGAGLSAADAVIAACFENISVYHAFRRHPDDPTLIFNQLPENMYPEYHKVHQKMKGKSLSSADYKAFPLHCVTEIRDNHQVVLTNLIGSECSESLSNQTVTVVQVSYVLALIGSRANLDFIYPKKLRNRLLIHPNQPFHSRNNPIAIDPYSYECRAARGLYALGPLVGDNFVRFVQGGALAIVNHYWKQKDEQQKAHQQSHSKHQQSQPQRVKK